jgi:hypothetical protein
MPAWFGSRGGRGSSRGGSALPRSSVRPGFGGGAKPGTLTLNVRPSLVVSSGVLGSSGSPGRRWTARSSVPGALACRKRSCGRRRATPAARRLARTFERWSSWPQPWPRSVRGSAQPAPSRDARPPCDRRVCPASHRTSVCRAFGMGNLGARAAGAPRRGFVMSGRDDSGGRSLGAHETVRSVATSRPRSHHERDKRTPQHH